MELEGAGLTQPDGTKYVLSLKFGKQLYGKQLYVTAELRRGEDAAAVAMKLREMAAQVEEQMTTIPAPGTSLQPGGTKE